jgi:hypothetical protein
MRNRYVAVAVFVVVSCISTSAQAPGKGDNAVSQAIRGGWNSAKQNLSGSAKVMPAEKYSFKPVETAKTRDAIVKALEDSFKYCDTAYAVDDMKLTEMIAAPFGGGQSPRAQALMGNTGHVQEHYGNLVTYLRINGLVPPSSAR